MLEQLKFQYFFSRIRTPLDQAVTELHKRRTDIGLRKEVNDFLQNDIPLHFNGRDPIFYLSRYIATPDYETLRFYEHANSYDWPIVIGEDTADIFTSHSSLKRNLLKLPIITGESKNGEGIVEYAHVGDFASQQGKQLRHVELHDHSSLCAFHGKLCREFMPEAIYTANESDWVSRHYRGNLVRLYENLLPLFLVHGIMLEQYETDETDFLQDVVWPAFKATKKRFGLTPLIAPLNLQTDQKIRDLNSYPAEVGKYVTDEFPSLLKK